MPTTRKPARKPVRTARSNPAESAKAEAIRELRTILKPGDTVYGIIRDVAASGMSRRIDFYKLEAVKGAKGQCAPRYLTYWFNEVLGYTSMSRDRQGLRVGGAGMDMVFKVIYDVSSSLFRGDRRVKGDPGYALKHETI